MSRKEWQAFGVGAAMIGLAAAFLAWMGSKHQLGEPGVKVVNVPIHLDSGEVCGTNSVYLPEVVADFDSRPLTVSTLEKDWLPADTVFGRRVYKSIRDGFEAQMSVVLMGHDRTSIHKPQYCLQGQGIRIDTWETTSIPMQRPHPYDLEVMKLTATKTFTGPDKQDQTVRILYVYWFVADDLLTPHHGERMWWMARDMILTGTLQRWAYISCLAVCRPGQEDAAFARMQDLIRGAVPEFQLAAPEMNPAPVETAFLDF